MEDSIGFDLGNRKTIFSSVNDTGANDCLLATDSSIGYYDARNLKKPK
jgi:hypothetical protein